MYTKLYKCVHIFSAWPNSQQLMSTPTSADRNSTTGNADFANKGTADLEICLVLHLTIVKDCFRLGCRFMFPTTNARLAIYRNCQNAQPAVFSFHTQSKSVLIWS